MSKDLADVLRDVAIELIANGGNLRAELRLALPWQRVQTAFDHEGIETWVRKDPLMEVEGEMARFGVLAEVSKNPGLWLATVLDHITGEAFGSSHATAEEARL